jgi:hypothetical protein
MLTRTLVALILLLAAAGAWRLARWHWRPRLVLPGALTLGPGPRDTHVSLHVRNEGAGRSRNCRATLVRCERREDVGWLRIEPPLSHRRGDPLPPGVGIQPGESATIELDHVLPATPGTYRLEIAVLNGEEKRSSYVVEVEAVPPGASS